MPIQTKYSNIYTSASSDSSRRAEKFKNSVEKALNIIYSAPSGQALLNSIMHYGPGKKLTISELESGKNPYTQAVLTQNQLERFPSPHFSENIRVAAQLSQTEGTNVIVGWSKAKSSAILHQDGTPKRFGKSNSDRVSVLAYGLIHAVNTMGGTALSVAENDQEERRAIGLPPYDHESTGLPTENSIRQELGLPLRTAYRFG